MIQSLESARVRVFTVKGEDLKQIMLLTKSFAFTCIPIYIHFCTDHISKGVERSRKVCICQIVRQMVNKQVRSCRTLTGTRVGNMNFLRMIRERIGGSRSCKLSIMWIHVWVRMRWMGVGLRIATCISIAMY